MDVQQDSIAKERVENSPNILSPDAVIVNSLVLPSSLLVAEPVGSKKVSEWNKHELWCVLYYYWCIGYCILHTGYETHIHSKGYAIHI